MQSHTMHNARLPTPTMRNARSVFSLYICLSLLLAAPSLGFLVPGPVGKTQKSSSVGTNDGLLVRVASASSLWSSRAQADVSRTWNQSPSRGRIAFSQENPTNKNKTSRQRLKTKPLPVTGYDADAIIETYDRRPLQVGWRLNSLGFPLLGKFFRHGVCDSRELEPSSDWLRLIPQHSFQSTRLVPLPPHGQIHRGR